eukprot:scaffold7768_cov110-Skeletonema_marinoi.AAC.8
MAILDWIGRIFNGQDLFDVYGRNCQVHEEAGSSSSDACSSRHKTLKTLNLLIIYHSLGMSLLHTPSI